MRWNWTESWFDNWSSNQIRKVAEGQMKASPKRPPNSSVTKPEPKPRPRYPKQEGPVWFCPEPWWKNRNNLPMQIFRVARYIAGFLILLYSGVWLVSYISG